MKFAMIAILLACSGCKATYYIACDSLCDGINEWPMLVNKHVMDNPQDNSIYFIHAGSQWGRGVTGYKFPSHLDGDEDTGFIIGLGVNDAMYAHYNGVDNLAEFEQAYADIMDDGALRGFTVTCVLVPYMPSEASWEWDAEPYREIQMRVCHEWIDVPLELVDSPDGLHMGPAGQTRTGVQMLLKLNEIHGD